MQQEIDDGKISGIYSVEIIENEYIEDGIRESIIKHAPDIIAINIKKKCFIQDLFLSDRSLNLLHEFHIPLLLFKEI